MKEKVECKENNLIWLADENDSDIIYTSKLVVTDEDKYGELLSYLKDYSNFVLASNDFVENPCVFTDEECIIHYLVGDNSVKYDVGHSSTVYRDGNKFNVEKRRRMYYRNPRANLLKILYKSFYENSQLLSLFSSLDFNRSKGEQVLQMKAMKELINKLKESNLDVENIKFILNSMCPNFGLFATEGLECITFEPINDIKYNLKDLRDIIKASVRANVKHNPEIDTILSQKTDAVDNTMVLSLARDINGFVNK